MRNISAVCVSKIIEGALEGDLQKVIDYAELIASNLDKAGDNRTARLIRSRLDGSYKDIPEIIMETHDRC